MNPQLIIPVYLDTNSLLDLLASIEGGFSVVEKVTSQNMSSSQSRIEADANASAEFGTPNFLSMLKLNLGIGLSGAREISADSQDVSEREKYHTYGSLFYRLRNFLDDQGLIKQLSHDSVQFEDIQLSDFVEIRGTLRPNPIVDTMEIMLQMLRFFESSQSITTPDGQTSAKTSNRRSSTKSKQPPQRSDVDIYREIAQDILDDIERGRTRAFVIETHHTVSPDSHYLRAVAVLFIDYLRDQTMYEVRDKEYYLLGKVVRLIRESSDERISLLRGAALDAFPDSTFNEMFKGFANLPDFNMPKISRHIDGPAIEIIPIAIFA